MNRVRIGLLIAAASLAGIPALAQAQDAGRREHREGRGDGGRDFQRGGDRGQVREGAPSVQAQPQAQPQPRVVADRAPPPGGYAHGYSGQTPNWRPRGPQATGNPAPAPTPQLVQNRQGDDRRRTEGNRGGNERRDWNGRDGNDRRGYDNRPRVDNRQAWRGNDTRSAWNDRRGSFSREWRNDRRYDWRSYRNVNRSLFRGRYIAPRGYGFGYRSFSIGLRIEPLFYAPNYWIDDPWQYRLPPVYGPYRWVRYYDDVLLVDIETGEVVDVIHDFFW